MTNGEIFTCKKCGETKPLDGFYTNSRVDKSRPYQLVCRKCYQAIRREREGRTAAKSTCLDRDENSKERQRKNHSLDNHANLECTIGQFHRFLGPKIRNEIQLLTKKEKQKLNGICQGHGGKAELEAAHVGKTRVQIINSILTKYLVGDEKQIISVDLEKVVDEIIEAHMPISQHFKFLCASCHREFDSKN